MAYDIQKTISELVPSDFLDSFKDKESLLIDFTQAYYKWLETANNTTYHARRMLDYRDIDSTPDEFIYHFKKKYLNGIQLNAVSDIRMLVKHSLDFLRARGTARADKLFFAAVYGVEANVYIPSNDIFRLSSGDWVIPQYLEVSHRDINPSYVGKEIVGVNSGAKCFVDRFITRKLENNGRIIEIFYISVIEGIFIPGELLKLNNGTVSLDCPVFLGSLAALDVTYGSAGFSIGDVVSLKSEYGTQGKAIVSGTETQIGTVNFTLVDGGYGYTSNAEVIISDEVIQIANMQIMAPNNVPSTVSVLTKVTQPLCQIKYQTATGLFTNGDIITTYSNTGNVVANGVVLRNNYNNTTTGILQVSPNYGNLSACTVYYNQGNVISASLAPDGFSDTTATGDVVAVSSNVVVNYSEIFGSWQVGDTIYQQNSIGFIVSSAVISSYFLQGSNGTLYLTNCTSLFQSNQYMYAHNSGATAKVSDITFIAGLYNVNGSFSSYNKNYITEQTTNSIGTISEIYQGSGASFKLNPALGFTELVYINTNVLNTANQAALLSSSNYGFPGILINANTLLSDLTFANIELGMISGFTEINPGQNYNYPPFVRITDEITEIFDLQDWILNITQPNGIFVVGELITQNTTQMRGIVKTSNSTVVTIKRLSFFDEWQANTTSTNSYYIINSTSGATAYLYSYEEDSNSLSLGNNAIVTENVVTSSGSVTNLKVIDSGFGFVNQEDVTFTSMDGERAGTARANCYTYGTGTGYYRYNGGFLSSDKKLRDGSYYQEYSYDIKSPLSLDTYEEQLKKVLHVAGMKYFGSVVKQSNTSINTNIITGGIKQFISNT